jgi:hypothetical protein
MKISFRKNELLSTIKDSGKGWIMEIPMSLSHSRESRHGVLNSHLINMNERFFPQDIPRIRYFSRIVVKKALEDFMNTEQYKALSHIDDFGVILFNNQEAVLYNLSKGRYTAISVLNGIWSHSMSVELSQISEMIPGVNYYETSDEDSSIHPLKGLPLLMLYHLAEKEVKVVAGANKKEILGNEKVYNDTSIPVELVNSNWFTTIIRNEGFGVKGHFGIRACGPGRSERRLTWIKPHAKNGYTRRAKLESLKE